SWWIPEPSRVKEFVPGAALSVATSFRVVSVPLAGMFSSVDLIPAGNPSRESNTSLVNPSRRSTLTAVDTSAAAEVEFVGKAVAERRVNVLERTNGTCKTVSGNVLLYWT